MAAAPSPGRVWLVGAGPGDPELLTLKGQRILAAADAVVHDRLIHPALLEIAPAGALRIDVGKQGYGHSVGQEEIQGLLVRLARQGRQVVRLKGGDPFVFGRGGEEVAALRAAGIEVQVIPGVSAGLAGPAAAGIPVTHRGLARSVGFVTGHEGGGGGPAVDWEALAGLDTLVVFMVGRTAGRVAARLLQAGRAPATPAALIVDATLPEAEVCLTDLGSLARDGGLDRRRPTLLVVGEVVRLAEIRAVSQEMVASPAPGVASFGLTCASSSSS
jgi:uroporphyrin-III C-methyltransferase